ncbi:DUF4139 domain-containing protein [Novosphingobium sp.]|uniref:DUF4139 domain-containing protein n=1 Tax=Novosphingobium sp. TaxID=1874826 RepID=UPI003D13107F
MRLFLASLIMLSAPSAHAQAIVAASAPVDTSVTIYRAPFDTFGNRPTDARDPLPWLAGYALISETREIDVPAGPAVIRFPGVAAGMLAESVVVSGLPVGVREKNLDAQLLSPRNLYAGWFGRPVTLRREDPTTGKVREENAVIRSAPGGAAIVQTDHGFEAMTCGPFSDSIAYPGVPDGLFPSPTLSIATDAPAPVHVRVRLAYLAWNYNWRADYVLKLAPDLHHATLSAWVTLASADVTSFPQTMAAVVAGKPNFSDARGGNGDGDQDLTYQCFPSAPASTPPPPPPPPAPGMTMDAMAMAAPIMVTARKALVAEAENLGDLKLFRLPQPTTVAARGQKQVALFDPRTIAIDVLHVAALDDLDGTTAAQLQVRTRNRNAEGLGLALPGGKVRIMAERDGHALVVGEGALEDRAINDRVEIGTAQTPQVTVKQTITARTKTTRTITATISNANPFAIRFEGTFKQTAAAAIQAPSSPLVLVDGHRVWSVRIPANGRAVLHYHMSGD